MSNAPNTRVDLSAIPSAFHVRLGIPRPDWDVISHSIDQECGEDQLNKAWAEIARQWMSMLKNAIGERYKVTESTRFLLLSVLSEEHNGELLRWCEGLREVILHALDGVARDEGFGKHVVLIFDSQNAYYDYVADFYPDDGEFGDSAGVFLDEGYGHIAVCFVDMVNTKRTVAHELTHAMLRHHPLPLWLNEGLTQIIEDIVMEYTSFTMDRELAGRHHEYWTEEKVNAFWAGESFAFPDDGQELSYSLAQVLVRNMLTDYTKKKFFDFACLARFEDAGNAAALQVMGEGLSDQLARFLGPGNWQPRSNYHQLEDGAAQASYTKMGCTL